MKKLVDARSVTPSFPASPGRFWWRLGAVCGPPLGAVIIWHALDPARLGVATVAAVVLAIVPLELTVGVLLGVGGRGMLHVFGAMAGLCIAVVFGAFMMASDGGRAAEPAALALGVFGLTTGLVRAVDLVVEGHPGGSATLRGIDCSLRLIAGILLAVQWRVADAELIGLCAAALLVGTGLAMACETAPPRAALRL